MEWSWLCAWSTNFLNEAKNLLDQENFNALKEKVRFFLLCKGRVTPNRIKHLTWLRRITGLVCLVPTPSLQFRCLNFVVDKGLLVPEEESAMYLSLSLNKKSWYTANIFFLTTGRIWTFLQMVETILGWCN